MNHAEVTMITASLGRRPELLAEAMASVAAQIRPAAHLIGIDPRPVAVVRNELIRAAATEWVGFLDDDDVLDVDHVSQLACVAEDLDVDVVIPHCRFLGPPLPRGYCNRPFDREALRRHGIFPITVLARRQAVLDAGGFALEGWDDWELWNAMADNGCRFHVTPKVTWTYRTGHDGRRTHALQAGGS